MNFISIENIIPTHNMDIVHEVDVNFVDITISQNENDYTYKDNKGILYTSTTHIG